jgi:hypothetical protein
MRILEKTAAAWCVLWVSLSISWADVRYPDGTVIDVTLAPYFADPTGVADNRAILQQVLDDHPGSMLERPIIYFPDGLYRLSGGLVVDTHNQANGGSGRGVVFQGQSRDGTVLRLDDGASGFGDPAEPKVFIDFNQANDIFGAWQYVAFQTHVKDLTIDIGAGNSGAIGLDFCANNVGGVRNVRVRSSDPDGAGRFGILLSSIPGPHLFKHVEVIGFDWSVRTENDPHYATTIEDMTLIGAREGGIFNRRHSFAIHRLRTVDLGGPAIRNDHPDAFTVLVDGSFTGGPEAGAALINEGFLYARNVRTSGYLGVIQDRAAGLIAQPNMSEWHYGTAEGLFDTEVCHSLGLPIQDAPDPPRDDPSEWVNVSDFGATPGDNWNNDAIGVQAAIASMAPGGSNEGRRTLYFPPGLYRFNSGVVITEHVERIVGCFASIQPRLAAIETQPVWTIAGGDRLLIIEQLTGYPGGPLRATPFFRNESERDVVIRDVLVLAGQTYVNTGSGRLFLENVGGTSSRYWSNLPQPLPEAIPQFDFGGQTVWARQLNTEQKDLKVRNEGGDVWILGLKNEEDGTYVQTLNGGRTEVLGGTAMPLDVDDFASPGFEILDACMSVIIAGHMGWARDHYEILVSETRNGETRDLLGVDAAHHRTYANSAGRRPPVLVLYRGSILDEAEHWRRTHFGTTAAVGLAAEDAMPDQDGLPNRLKRALGISPGVADVRRLPEFGVVNLDGQSFPSLAFRRLAGGGVSPAGYYEARGLRYRVEVSTDLQTWTSGSSATVLHEAAFDEGDGTESVTVRSLQAFDADQPLFLRLSVEEVP